MASDSEMNNALDPSEIGDADSLVSTAESEEEAEYLVNDIHAERRFYVEPDSEDDEGVFITQYLVEWAGYSMDRCSWEPKEMFTSEETLEDWEEKKKQIAEGKVPRFDLKSWEKRMALLEKKTKKRKEDRRRKREQRARQRSLPQAESSRLANPGIIDADEPEADTASHRAPSCLSVDSMASALFVEAETPPPSKTVARQLLQQMAPPRSATSSAQTPRNEPPGSTTLIAQRETSPGKPNSRLSQLAKKLSAKHKPKACPKSPPQAAKPTLSSFGTGSGAKRASRDNNKWSERAPDLSQMKLMKPSEFPPRMNIVANTPVIGPSVTSPKSPKAPNQPASENSVRQTGLVKTHTVQTDDKATKQPQKPVVLAPSSVMAPPVSRSSNLGSTASVSSSAVLSGPSAPLNAERHVGPVDSTPSFPSSATQPKPPPQADLTQPVDSVDSTVPTFSPAGEAPLKNPAGRPTSALITPSPAPRPPSQANIDTPTGPSASTSSVFPPVVLSGARAEATSMKPAGLSDPLNALSPAIPTRPRARVNLERPTGNRHSQDSRETVRGWDNYRPDSAYNTIVADTYRPSERSHRPSPSRWSSPPRRSSPSRRPRSPPPRRPSPSRWSSPSRRLPPSRRSRSPRSRRQSPSRWSSPPRRSRSPPPSRPSRSSHRDMGGSYAPRSPSPSHHRIASRSSNLIGLNVNPSANAQAFVPTEPRAGPPAQPSLSIAAQIARMPVRDSRAPGCRKIGDYWCNKVLGEVLVHIFIGPDRRPLGAFRLCGIPQNVRQCLMFAKNPETHQVEVWFKYLCTVRDYERLCESSAINSVRSTGWLEGFSDTNENLVHLAEDLRKDDLIAIHYPAEQRKGLAPVVWLAWSHGSQEFKFPDPNDEVPPGIPLLVAARTMLAPIETLGASGPSQPSERPHSLLPDTSLSLRVQPPSAGDGLESGSHTRRSNFHHDTGMSGSLQSRETLALAPFQRFPPAGELKDNSIGANPQPQDNLAVQAAKAAVQAVDEFMKAHKISVEELATIEEGGKLSKAHMFYLHFPLGNEEVQMELQLLQRILDYYKKIVFTSDNPEDWAKFVHSSRQGVAIFHESFAGYDTLHPPLNSVLPTNPFNFWIVRIQRPLELVDPRYCSPSDHGLRIFPHGGVILLTEDVLTDLKGVAVTLQWIRNVNKNKRKSWTLMLPPGILDWIERRLSDENHSQDHGLLLLIHMLIIKNNATDPRTGLFDTASLHLNSKSNVIAPSLNEYGTRTEHHGLKIKDKIERDADHLIEFFAGWSLINVPRFRNFIAVTSLSATTGPRWNKWGHMTVMRGGFAHFFKRFKIDSVGLMGYLSGAKPQASVGQVATPMTATTPLTPNWASHNSNAAIQSTFTGSPNGNGTNKYPAPYK
ncbi:unnamed protein product [Penicillium egyptiacum]|uniref:Chromo domain-containing protein n=1 Tax=Penicillium egyptiacum TaxID=1303716 RepID=A0A9W4P2H2_9EURO|nr:unnamed protein product [Penicillium egyptiacum]